MCVESVSHVCDSETCEHVGIDSNCQWGVNAVNSCVAYKQSIGVVYTFLFHFYLQTVNCKRL